MIYNEGATIDLNRVQENLENLGIFQLRNLARQVGVAVPTTLKREDLINGIVSIVSGKEQPKFRKDKKGRPAKQAADVGLLASVLRPKNNTSFIVMNSFDSISHSMIASFEATKIKENKNIVTTEIQGLVHVSSDGYALLYEVQKKSSNDFYYIKRQMVFDYALSDGDKVVAKVSQEKTTEPIVISIIEVNGVKDKKDEVKYDFVLADKEQSNKRVFSQVNAVDSFYSELLPVYCGDRCLINIPEKEIFYPSVLDFVKKASASENLTDVVAFGVNCADEVVSQMKSLPKVSVLLSRFGDNENYQKSLAQLALKNAINLASTPNKNVMFIVLDLQQVLTIFNGQEQKEFLDAFKKIFSQAKQTNKSSLTVCYVGIENDKILQSFEPNQNVLLDYLPLKYLTKSEIKYNLITSFRQEVAFDNIQRLALRQSIVNFLTKNSNDYALLEKLIKQNNTIQSLINELDN